MRVAIVGSRTYPEIARVRAYVRALPPGTVVVSGGAPGVDREAVLSAREHGLETEEFFADWRAYGRAAGSIRNRALVESVNIVVAFWDGVSRGTADTIALARAKGIPVTVIFPTGQEPPTLI